MSSPKSFTLIELLIVIGILAVLVAAIVITLNPAQLLAQARDSKRQQDLSALNQALNTITTLDQSLFMGTSSLVYTSLPDSSSTCGSWGLPTLPSGWQYHCSPTSSLQSATGTGWIPVNFKTTGVVSLSSLPTDPINASSSNLFYTYVSGGSFQLASHFESAKYQLTQGSDAMYTVGSNLNLAPFLSGLVGWWKFDETSGTTTADSSGYNNTGIMYSSTTPTYILTSSGCKAWNCGSFDGVGKFIRVLNNPTINPGTQNLTINAWFNASSLVTGILYNKENLYEAGFGGNCGAGSTVCYAWMPAWAWRAQIPVDTNVWNMVTFIYDHTQQLVYKNGALVYSISQSGDMGSNINNLTFGARTDGASNPYTGLIDDVRIYNRALSASEISGLYNATR